ncbi:MAG: D-alanyl-D-alanine carboxypeptidase/D-alanyl-D-alanine-endopeptidase [Chroococcales cyanobacterium]
MQLVSKEQIAIAEVSSPISVAQSDTICEADLKSRIASIINRPEFRRSHWGILIQPLNSNLPLYAANSERYFIPASNVKLLTTAAVLRQLSPFYRLRTSIYAVGNAPYLTELRIIGQGDPSLTTEDLQQLAQQLKQQGITQIDSLIVEEENRRKPAINPTWESGDTLFYYGSAVNGLILNENAAILTLLPQEVGQSVKWEWNDAIAARQWRIQNEAVTAPPGTPYNVKITGVLGQPILRITGELAADAKPDIWGMAVGNPADYFLETLRQTLLTEGITVNQSQIQTTVGVPLSSELVALESDTLAELVTKTNKESNNLYSESLLNLLDSLDSSQSGVNVLEETLTELGVNPNSYSIVDGSGLSRHNLVSPEAIVQTLQLMAQTPEGEIYRNSLPMAGIDGTLKWRFQDTASQGNVQAKTGTMTGVSALSGYLNASNYQPLVFSIMVNQSDQSARIQREAIDEIVSLLQGLRRCN